MISESSLTSEDKILSMTPGLAEKAIIQDSHQLQIENAGPH